MKTVAIIQARMGSTRLPGKVLMHLEGPSVLERVVTAAEQAHGVDQVWVATTSSPKDDPIVDWCKHSAVECWRGSEDDVLQRFWDVAEATRGDIFLRLTGDCPFLDPNVISEVIALRKAVGADYASNIDPATWPDGLDTECFTIRALACAHDEATRMGDRDCVTRFIVRNRHRFKAVNLTCPIPRMDRERWVLDTEDDYKFCCELAKRVTHWPPSYLEILSVLEKEPDLRKINSHHPRNERFYDGLSTEVIKPRSVSTSKVLLKQAEKYIPLGAQTFSKSKLQYPDGSPLFLSHGDGAYVYDCDGNDYVDLVSGLLPVILGYRDVDVDRAVRDQLDRGISLSLATELEYELAQRLNHLIPCAEMVRFGKTGSDVTTAAVRLARYHTGRDLILSAGYHGWHDWSICNDIMRGNGTTEGGLVKSFPYGDDISRDILTECYAAVIVEPESHPAYLHELLRCCNKSGTVLIFDEVITGFRWSMGGAQKHWGVTPDLACFGKAIGNGMPISAIVGKRDIMKKMAPPDNIFFSGTFFGECLSLAAAIATIDKLQRENVPQLLTAVAGQLEGAIKDRLIDSRLIDAITIHSGPLNRLSFHRDHLRNSFVREMAQQGVLIGASHNLTWAHREPQIKRVLTAYDHVLPKLADLL